MCLGVREHLELSSLLFFKSVHSKRLECTIPLRMHAPLRMHGHPCSHPCAVQLDAPGSECTIPLRMHASRTLIPRLEPLLLALKDQTPQLCAPDSTILN